MRNATSCIAKCLIGIVIQGSATSRGMIFVATLLVLKSTTVARISDTIELDSHLDLVNSAKGVTSQVDITVVIACVRAGIGVSVPDSTDWDQPYFLIQGEPIRTQPTVVTIRDAIVLCDSGPHRVPKHC